jgi:hypothetical protein
MAGEPIAKVWESYIACQCQVYQKVKNHEAEKFQKPFVTISRQTGAGGITIGQKLIQYLQEHDQSIHCPWTLFDRNLIQAVLDEHHFPESYHPH